MIHLNIQPFLLSLRQDLTHTSHFEGHKTMLYGHQSAFKEYVQNCCDAETPMDKRFEFLKQADYELCSIRLLHADRFRKHDIDFYRYWSMMIVDTRRFLSIGLETIKFLTICPKHLLGERPQTLPTYQWTGTRNDLTEAIVGVYQADVIRMKDGSRPSFALFAKFIGGLFGITYKYPQDDFRKIMSRKKNPTPFLNRMINSIKDKNDVVNM